MYSLNEGSFYDGDGYMLNLGIIEIFRELKKTPFSLDPFNCFGCPSGGIRLNKHLRWNILLILSPLFKKNARRGPRLKVLVIEVLFCSPDRHYESDLSPSVTGAASHVFMPCSRWIASKVKEMNNVIRIRVVCCILDAFCARVHLLLQTFL